MKFYVKIALAAAVLLAVGCRREVPVDPLKRSQVDGLNKEAFVNRYREPDSCIALSERALQLVEDSLPDYVDGQLRALNNKAFAYYQVSDYENARRMVDRVDKTVALRKPSMHNGDIERVIASLLEARMMQRAGQIADSYRILYDIGKRSLQHIF